MKKITILSLFVLVVAFSGCSVAGRKFSEPSQESAQDNLLEAETGNQTQELEKTENIIYEDANFNFKITMPLNWQDYKVQSREVKREFYGLTYTINELDFGFPVKLLYDQENNEVNVEKCDSCFIKIFTLTVYNRSDYDEISANNEAEIAKNGATPATNLGNLIGSNGKYVFMAPSNIHGQAYDGQFIYDRQTEAAAFLSDFEAY
ncbi:MAG: hypothetical protein PHG95_00875 [Patescibacteria group bacterium]|nr:hypothetical protein [Patescibacteria group bacterium]